MSPWRHLHLSPSYDVLNHTNHIFSESLSSGDDTDMVEMDMVDMDMVYMDMVDMDMVYMDMVDMDMVDMDMMYMDFVDIYVVYMELVDMDMVNMENCQCDTSHNNWSIQVSSSSSYIPRDSSDD